MKLFSFIKNIFLKIFRKKDEFNDDINYIDKEELKSAIKRIYKENKGIYGAPRIHHILAIEGFNVSIEASSKTND